MLDARAQIRDDGEVDLPLADDETFRRAAELVEALAAHHGLSEVRLGQHGGELVVTVGADRDYFDLVRFEMELESLLRARIRVVSSGAPGARARGRSSSAWSSVGSLTSKTASDTCLPCVSSSGSSTSVR